MRETDSKAQTPDLSLIVSKCQRQDWKALYSQDCAFLGVDHDRAQVLRSDARIQIPTDKPYGLVHSSKLARP